MGVMPRFLIYLSGLGVTVARWLGGCVVRLVIGRGMEGRLRVVREGSVIELGVRVEDGIEGAGGDGEVLGGVGRVIRGLIGSLTNLLTDFYSLSWKQEAWVGGRRGREGEEWAEITELQREMLFGRGTWWGRRLDVLVPELGFSGQKGKKKFVFKRKEVEFVEEVGKGGFGVVWKGVLKGKREEGRREERLGEETCICSCSCSCCLSSCVSSSSSPSSSSCSCPFRLIVAIKELSTFTSSESSSSSEDPSECLSSLSLTTSSFLPSSLHSSLTSSPPSDSTSLPTLVSSLSSHAVADFEREVWLMSSLRHPNLVNLHGIGVGKIPFMVMELLCGGLSFSTLFFFFFGSSLPHKFYSGDLFFQLNDPLKVIFPLSYFWSQCERAIFNRWLKIEKQKKKNVGEWEAGDLPSFRMGGKEEWEKSGFVFDRGEGGDGREKGSKDAWRRVEEGLMIWGKVDKRVEEKKRLLVKGLDQGGKDIEKLKDLVKWMVEKVSFFLFDIKSMNV